LLGAVEQTVEWADRAFADATRCGDTATLGKASFVRAYECFWSGRPAEGVEHGTRAVAHLAQTDERWWLGRAYWIVAINAALRGEFSRALEALAQEQVLGDAMDDPRLQSSAGWTRGGIHALMGEWEAGLAACQRALERARDPVDAALARGFLGGVHLEMGDGVRARPWLEQAAAQCRTFGVGQTHGWFTTLLGEAYRLIGEHERAHALATEGLGITETVQYRYGMARAHQVIGRIAHARGAFDESEQQLRRALEMFVSMGARYDSGRAHLDLAGLSGGQGQRSRAAAHLHEARAVFEALKVPRYVERTNRLAQELGLS
jgi:tetratricopeptide (TPR) repeat protein